MKINSIFVKLHTKRIRLDRMHSFVPFLIFRIPHSNFRILLLDFMPTSANGVLI